MQVGWVKIGDFWPITGYISKTVKDIGADFRFEVPGQSSVGQSQPWKVPGQNATFAPVLAWVPGRSSRLPRCSRRLWERSEVQRCVASSQERLFPELYCCTIATSLLIVKSFIFVRYQRQKCPFKIPMLFTRRVPRSPWLVVASLEMTELVTTFSYKLTWKALWN